MDKETSSTFLGQQKSPDSPWGGLGSYCHSHFHIRTWEMGSACGTSALSHLNKA